MSGPRARRIDPEFRSKIWGSWRTEPWFKAEAAQPVKGASGDPIGEVCFTADNLLIKFIFTSQNLSVQVHPDDDYAKEHENSRGKNEMWHILRAEPGARIALGFKSPIASEQLIPASRSGEIMDLLQWIEVHPGETYFVPARTVHAIGAGIALCEIQQKSDITYRLFDYGRGRDLHWEAAGQVSDLGCHPGRARPRQVAEDVRQLVDCEFFRTFSAVIRRPRAIGRGVAAELDTRFLIVLEGAGRVNNLPASAGHVFAAEGSREWFIEPDAGIESGSMELLLVR